MARQVLAPGDVYVNETDSNEILVPGGVFVNETVVITPPAPSGSCFMLGRA